MNFHDCSLWCKIPKLRNLNQWGVLNTQVMGLAQHNAQSHPVVLKYLCLF